MLNNLNERLEEAFAKLWPCLIFMHEALHNHAFLSESLSYSSLSTNFAMI